MNLEKYEDYFKNILARTFVTNAQKKTITLQNSEVTDVFIEVYANKKSHILGIFPNVILATKNIILFYAKKSIYKFQILYYTPFISNSVVAD